MKNFSSEFNTLNYVINNSRNILLVAHSNPDGDTAGSVSALADYLAGLGKKIDITCYDPLPEYLKEIVKLNFEFPDHLKINSYDAIIACDSVERGFNKIIRNIYDNQITVLIDHHPDIILKGDINIIDPSFSSVCEIIYNFLNYVKADINKNTATCLMLGIIGDTGIFKHANTTSRVMEIAAELLKKGASLTKITKAVFSNKKISTLKLWGMAFEKARIVPKNAMIITVLTQKDIKECDATTDDIAQVASILNTVPGTKFSLVLSEREAGIIKGSLRSEEYKGADVSAIASRFGGGGHKLASGFEIKGRIIETGEGWKIV